MRATVRGRDVSVRLREAFNGHLDNVARPRVHVCRLSWPAFQVCGCAGLSLATLLAMTLVMARGLSPRIMAVLVLSAILTFFGLVMVTKILMGEERIIYYHHEIAVMVVATFLLWRLRQPILPYLDVTILGVGLFLACGRVGCLMAGCCHGRPSPWGVCYQETYADTGFTRYYIGVRLFPVQALESLWVCCIVLVGSAYVLAGYPPGTALSWYVVAYDLGRFCFESARGDPDRSYLWGFSQPQWISLLLLGAVVWAELAGLLPFHLWHAGATIFLALAMVIISLSRRFEKTAKHQLLHPHHVREVAEAIARVSNLATEAAVLGRWTVMPRQNPVPADIRVGCTSLGVQISASKIRSTAGYIYHYALSYPGGGMSEETARVLARLILQLKRATGSGEFLKGDRDVFHLLIHP